MATWNGTGFDIRVSQGDRWLDVDEDGLLRYVHVGEKLHAHLYIPRKGGSQTVVFMTDGLRNPTIKKDHAEGKGDCRRHVLTVPVIHEAKGRYLRAGSYPQNLMRVSTITRVGYVHTWEIALFGQWEGIFITTQDRSKESPKRSKALVQAHRDDQGNVSFPYLTRQRNWKSMNDFLVTHLAAPKNLPHPDSFTPPKGWKMSKIPDGFGRVKFFNFANGVGSVVLSEKDEKGKPKEARVHWSQVLRTSPDPSETIRRDFLLPDELVSYTELRKVVQIEGQRATKFEWEVRGVRLAFEP